MPSANTTKAYAADWTHYARWCRATGTAPLPPDPEALAAYVDSLHGTLSPPSIDRRLAGLRWSFAARGMPLEDATLRRLRPSEPQDHHPARKDALSEDDVAAMVATLPRDLRGMRDRAILCLGHAAGLGRGQLVGLDLVSEATPDADGDARGHVKVQATHVTLILPGSTRDIPCAAKPDLCPQRALALWLRFSRIDSGPLFRRCSRDGTRALEGRLNDRHVARLIKRCAVAAGLRPDLSDAETRAQFSGLSLRAERNA
ncbi:integrase [Maritimibacter sp. DP1N21-5]|uniref:integrase n=1 Tax=Maritimibacter sp. DP1N21-5 TaxID=2836867 RepID=UPI001C47F695|nr:integrase [Maritimibacter sp. DP1N21-5]MBV7407348.1 integrase [Maritimibacter sp. DP1N21-5]